MELRKKILIIHPALAPYRIDFFNHLNEYYDIKLLLLKDNFTDNPFDQVELQNNLKFEKKVFRKVLNLNSRTIPYSFLSEIRDYNPDIVICPEFSLVNNLVLIYRLILNKHFIILTITDDNEFMIHCSGSLLRRLNRNLICKLIDGIITLDIPEVRDYYKKKIKGNRVIGVNHLVRDKKKFKDKLISLYQNINDSKLNACKEKKLLFVGRLVKEKGLDILVKVIDRLVAIHTNIIVYVVGDGKERSNLATLIKNFGLEKFIFIEGRKEGLELLKYYLLCDIFIFPSRHEPFGAVVNEALLSGLPVICSNQVGAKCLIDEGFNGSVFNIGDNDSFFNSINYWLSRTPKSNEYPDRAVLTDVDVKDEVKKLSIFLNSFS